MLVRSRAPARISFGGGGTDVPPFDGEYGGLVLSTTVNKYVYGTLQTRTDKQLKFRSADYKRSLEFEHIGMLEYTGDLDLMKAVFRVTKPEFGADVFLRSDITPNSGLGTSASACASMLGLVNFLKEKKLDNFEISELAYSIEVDELKNKSGRQDQYAAVFGGFNLIEFKGKDAVKVSPIKISKDRLYELEKNMLLAYTGPRESSGKIVGRQIESVMKNQKDVVDALISSKLTVKEMYRALEGGNFDEFGRLLDEQWQYKKKFNPLVTNKRIDALYDAARKNGALGGKITGAGGGGFMVFLCESNTEQIGRASCRERV